jgi:cytochrome c peroxidase
MSRSRFVLGLSLAVGVAGAAAPARASDAGDPGAASSAAPFYAETAEKMPAADSLTALGRALFFDAALSTSGKMSCASCHDPTHAFAAPNTLSVQAGGSDGRQSGVRAVPSLMYTQNVPAFTEHYVDDDGDDSVDQGPVGGRTWDGRAASVHDQAELPLLSPFEMANRDARAVVSKVRRAAYAGQFRAVFGDQVFADGSRAYRAVLLALETYQQNPREFYPYASKYDAWLRGESALSPQEMRGLRTFNDPSKGNCARCHPSGVRGGAFPQFTDFGYAAIGVPRNRDIPANADGAYFELGLCGALRTDLAGRQEYCGMFRTPSLRNVATRKVFFHNGVLRSLKEVVRFYAERDMAPEKWYSGAPGPDDLPKRYAANVDVQPPFGRQRGQQPALSAADIEDIVVFLQTLTDRDFVGLTGSSL